MTSTATGRRSLVLSLNPFGGFVEKMGKDAAVLG